MWSTVATSGSSATAAVKSALRYGRIPSVGGDAVLEPVPVLTGRDVGVAAGALDGRNVGGNQVFLAQEREHLRRRPRRVHQRAHQAVRVERAKNVEPLPDGVGLGEDRPRCEVGLGEDPRRIELALGENRRGCQERLGPRDRCGKY